MKREAIEFYEANQTPLEKLVLVGVNRKDLTEASVTAAAELLYEDIQGGLKVPSVRIAWEVFSRARVLKGHVEKKELDRTIGYLKELEWYHQPWWKTIFRRPPRG